MEIQWENLLGITKCVKHIAINLVYTLDRAMVCALALVLSVEP